MLKHNFIVVAHILYFSDMIFLSSCSSQLCGSNALNFVLNGAILTLLFTIYCKFFKKNIAKTGLDRFSTGLDRDRS